MSALLDNGLEVTALHNHFFWDEPRMFYMHVHGHGAPMDLARKVKRNPRSSSCTTGVRDRPTSWRLVSRQPSTDSGNQRAQRGHDREP